LFSSSEVNKIDLLDLKKNKKLIIPPEIKSKFRINYIRKNFLKSESFKKILNNNDVFVSPRKKEGIGMAQVEAISQGKYIIGYNDSTMKEYIKNEKIGFIFPSNKKIKISLINKFFNYRLNDNKKSYNKWEKDKKKILIFFNKKIKKTVKNKINYIDIFLSYYLKLIFNIHIIGLYYNIITKYHSNPTLKFIVSGENDKIIKRCNGKEIIYHKFISTKFENVCKNIINHTINGLMRI
jgi:hypothetical protein